MKYFCVKEGCIPIECKNACYEGYFIGKKKFCEFENHTTEEIFLNPTQQKLFDKNIKCGVYQILYKKGLLTREQLNRLLNDL